jgi:hypothetical protein
MANPPAKREGNLRDVKVSITSDAVYTPFPPPAPGAAIEQPHPPHCSLDIGKARAAPTDAAKKPRNCIGARDDADIFRACH